MVVQNAQSFKKAFMRTAFSGAFLLMTACGSSEIANDSVFEKPLLVPLLEGTALSTSEIRLDWQDVSANPTGTQLIMQRKKGNDAFSDVIRLPTETSSYVHNSLSANTTYVFRVVAQNTDARFPEQNSAVLSLNTPAPEED